MADTSGQDRVVFPRGVTNCPFAIVAVTACDRCRVEASHSRQGQSLCKSGKSKDRELNEGQSLAQIRSDYFPLIIETLVVY